MYRFTDSAENVEFSETLALGLEADTSIDIYEPTAAGECTARRVPEGLDPLNKEIRGVIKSNVLTFGDLRAGKFDDATITEFFVDLKQSANGVFIEKLVYYITSVAFDGENWQAQIDGLTGFINTNVGDVWGYGCRALLFSTGAGKCNATSFSRVDQVGTVLTPRLSFEIGGDIDTDANLGPVLGGFPLINGHVEFLSGNNKGSKYLIRTAAPAGSNDGQITLQEKTQFDLGGEQIRIHPGCNKQSGIGDPRGHCKNAYNNLVNFQGEPFIPGRDRASEGIPVSRL